MIYIRDMDMPVDCLACWISCRHESYQVTGRPEDCPLEEAKDGDLISRADAIEAVASADETNGTVKVFSGLEVIDILKALPSAEAVQGEWTDIDNYYRMATCSRCHKVTMFEKWGEYTKPYDFCPNCGAKMSKGGDSE